MSEDVGRFPIRFPLGSRRLMSMIIDILIELIIGFSVLHTNENPRWASVLPSMVVLPRWLSAET